MSDLRKSIKTKELTQAKAAEILGVSQSRVSGLTRGKWERFSLEMLITLATRAGMRVSLKIAAGAGGKPSLNRTAQSAELSSPVAAIQCLWRFGMA
jgi:transcriptional regulator with XRE-family HTH domain